MLLHRIIECLDCVVTDLLQVLQSSSQDVNCSCVLCRLDAEVHRILSRMGNGVSTEGHIGTEMRESGGGYKDPVRVTRSRDSLSGDDGL